MDTFFTASLGFPIRVLYKENEGNENEKEEKNTCIYNIKNFNIFGYFYVVKNYYIKTDLFLIPWFEISNKIVTRKKYSLCFFKIIFVKSSSRSAHVV